MTEVNEVMAIQNVTFIPPLLQKFLLRFGNTPAISHILMSSINDLKEYKDYLQEIGLELSETAFIFEGGDVHVRYIETMNRDENPPVRFIYTSEGAIIEKAPVVPQRFLSLEAYYDSIINTLRQYPAHQHRP